MNDSAFFSNDNISLADSIQMAAEYGSRSEAMIVLMIKVSVVFALMFLFYWLLKLAKKGQLPGFKTALSARRPMKVLSALSLGQRRQAVLLQVSGRVLLLGLGEGGIRTLGRFEGSEAEHLVEMCDGDDLPFKVHMARGCSENDGGES